MKATISWRGCGEKKTALIVRAAVSKCDFAFYLMGSGSLSDKPPSVEVDEQPGRERLLLHPGEAGDRDGRRILPRERHQLFTVLERRAARKKTQKIQI